MSSQPVQGAATLDQSLSLKNAADSEIENANADHEVALDDPGREFDHPPVQVPPYLQETYWWAYIHPAAVRFFERQWLVNLILWGNFTRLRDLALDELGHSIRGDILQVACVYGNFTEYLIKRLDPTARLAVVDVAQVQLENLKNKLPDPSRVTLHHQDSTHLRFADASYDSVVVFFLLHEQPEEVRAQTIAQALRVVKPGGKVVFVDYHRPSAFNPFRYVMTAILTTLEPFAMDLWRREISHWLPERHRGAKIDKQTYFGGLYQKVVITV
ncbi:MAG: methyltransferase domain-containing protein [Candidatus Competibacteraceae bacterium]|nr:methyltransferase domain-containing protein [Candidatus Competibacteraceae bacterium]MBK8898212.1 methyltransferase domain-containing protein [Candidatus Competibacteraceae bacterium]MBK9951234.1 methyltransferase domain-containing protein [Candidatus Competibacteraceae bacterium]